MFSKAHVCHGFFCSNRERRTLKYCRFFQFCWDFWVGISGGHSLLWEANISDLNISVSIIPAVQWVMEKAVWTTNGSEGNLVPTTACYIFQF